MPLLGELLTRNDGPTKTPEVPRQGDTGIFAFDVTALFGGTAPTMTVIVEHRNGNQDPWETAGTFDTVTSEGVKTKSISDLKEFVRLKFEIVSGSANSFMRFQILPPLWK